MWSWFVWNIWYWSVIDDDSIYGVRVFSHRDRITACVTPVDVNNEISEVHVEAPNRIFSFNKKGDANMSFEIFQVGSILAVWRFFPC